MILPARLAHHVRDYQLRTDIDRFEIDADRPLPVFERVVEDGFGRRIDGGVVDENVDRPEARDQIVDDAADMLHSR